jgi:hypothetical protein
LPDGIDMTPWATLIPGFVALCDPLQVYEELLVLETLSSLRNDWLQKLPNSKNSPLVSKKRSS